MATASPGPATGRTDRSNAAGTGAVACRASTRWTCARPWRLLRRWGGWHFEAAAERQVQVHALRQRFGLHPQQCDTRVGGGHLLLLQGAAVGAANAQRGLGEFQC